MHGVTGGKIDMMPLADMYVKDGYAVYSVDLPGHGGSELPKLDSYDDLANWLVRVIREINRAPDIILSNSYASSIVYHYLVRGLLPDHTRVILGCPTPVTSRVVDMLQHISNHAPKRLAWATYNMRAFQIIRSAICMNIHDADVQQWFNESESYKKATLTATTANLLTTLLYKQNPYVVSPSLDIQRRVTVVMGKKDSVVGEAGCKKMQQLLPGSTFKFLEESGHILHFEAWRELTPHK